jgi:hypothetical protein
MDTPEFLVWAIDYTCPVRGFQSGSDPERTERQLRAARATSDARREARVFEGLCVDPPDGFRISETLAIYGGLTVLQQTCRGCPANALAQFAADSLAGCYGVLALPADEHAFHATVDEAIDHCSLGSRITAIFPSTKPWWYGLWMDSPLRGDQLSLLRDVLHAMASPSVMNSPISELVAGLQTAHEADLSMHVGLYPRGHVEETSWKLVPHCPRCKSRWSEARSGR